MSLLPKIDEVRCVVHEENPDLVCITETWLRDSTINELLFIPGYNVMFKNRASQLHGGVCIYIKNLIPYKRLSDLEDPEFEVLWSHIRPPRLPRGTPCIIVGTIYHPPRSDDSAMLDYLITTLISLEGLYPGCGILLTGDFNHLKIQRLVAQFKMKQLVRIPTRGNNILDLIITNMHQAYDCNSVCTIPPFGLSDHNGVLLRPKERSPNINSSRKILEKRDTRPSRKYEFGRYLSSIDWAILETVDTCEAKSQLLTELITTSADIIMPLKRVKVHVNDPPWVTSDFKKLIKARQQAYSNGEIETYRHYRNLVNRERKIIRNRFFASKVRHLKDTKPNQWWNAVKRIAGMSTPCGFETLRAQLQIPGTDSLPPHEIANMINVAFLEPMQTYQSIDPPPPFESIPDLSQISVEAVSSILKKLPHKAPGPDGIPNWILKEYALILSDPICHIIRCSLADQCLPFSWKLANIIPVPKQSPVQDVNNHLRPISLTPAISKVAEEFVVKLYIAPAILQIIDPCQFGVIPKSSTAHALISMIHNWAQATDATGAAVRIVLFDYKKAFDLIDHQILLQKVFSLNIPTSIARWVADFLTNRKQRVKLSHDCFSEWGDVPSGVPQGTKLGPWLFVLMINDLKFQDVSSWKFVDDTTISEVVQSKANSHVQNAVTHVEKWSAENKLQLNAKKCKELIIDFKHTKQVFDPLSISGNHLNVVKHQKILGLIISSDLQWNIHIAESIKKANKRMYFLVLLKRAGVPSSDIRNFFCTCIRPLLEYCSQVFHHSLPIYLCEDLENVQKRALAIIFPNQTYAQSLQKLNLTSLKERRSLLCDKWFSSIVSSESHKLRNLLPPLQEDNYNIRNKRLFSIPMIRTERFKRTFIPSMCTNF